MANQIELLAWDTEFFGFPIGKVALEGATEASLHELEDEAFDLGVTCLYGTLDAGSEPATAQLAQLHGHRLVDVAQKFARPAVPFTPRPTEAVARRGTPDDLARLDDVLATLEPWSRFGADPRFGSDASRRILGAWVERAARDTEERMLAIVEDETGIIGVSTHVRSPVPRVDLMGVTKPRTGAAWALMTELVEWAGGGAIEAGPCAARNVAPIRYLEHCGFSLISSEYRYHWWADEQDRARR